MNNILTGDWLREIVFGLNDGLVTTLVFIMAVRQIAQARLLLDELGVVEDTQVNPWLEGMQVGLSFVLGGLIPTVPLLLSLPQARWWAYGLTALTALALGAIKAHYTRQGPVRAGLEFLVVVTLGTLVGVGLGLLLHGG